MIAPTGAVAWTPEDGWLYRDDPVPVALEDGDVVLVVSDDASCGACPRTTARHSQPSSASTQIQDTGNAVEIAALRTRLRRLEEATR